MMNPIAYDAHVEDFYKEQLSDFVRDWDREMNFDELYQEAMDYEFNARYDYAREAFYDIDAEYEYRCYDEDNMKDQDLQNNKAIWDEIPF